MPKLPVIAIAALAIFLIPSSATAQDGAALYKKNCILCHGEMGKGDGPMGPAMKASDLTDSVRMATYTDDALAEIISKGGKKMPKNTSLTAEQVASLVAYIRAFVAKT